MTRCALGVVALSACTFVADATSGQEVETPEALVPECPAVDPSAGVPTYRGLAGTFVRFGPAVVDEPVRLALVTVRDDPDADGTFAGTRGAVSGLPRPYAGLFHAVSDNPAIGAAMALDLDADGQFDKTFFVLGLRRSAFTGKVTALCLVGGSQPFQLTRLF